MAITVQISEDSQPACEAAKSWHVSLHVAPDGAAYALDAENCQVYRIADGTVPVLHGDG